MDSRVFILVPMILIGLCIMIGLIALSVYLIMLVIRALRKYISSGETRRENAVVRRSLGEALKAERLRCQMTQEFVAERLGVSRQAVSKWENGTSDPSTSNLLALARLYGVDAAELLRCVSPDES